MCIRDRDKGSLLLCGKILSWLDILSPTNRNGSSIETWTCPRNCCPSPGASLPGKQWSRFWKTVMATSRDWTTHGQQTTHPSTICCRPLSIFRTRRAPRRISRNSTRCWSTNMAAQSVKPCGKRRRIIWTLSLIHISSIVRKYRTAITSWRLDSQFPSGLSWRAHKQGGNYAEIYLFKVMKTGVDLKVGPSLMSSAESL